MFVGIDPSINSTGICIIKNEKTTFYNIKPRLTKKEIEIILPDNFFFVTYDKTESREEIHKTTNFINIADRIEEIVATQDDEPHIVIEGIAYGSSSSSVCDLAGLNHIIRERLIKYDIEVVPPAQIKKFATGKGNANKDKMIERFEEDYGNGLDTLVKIDDLADAYWMAKYAKVMHVNR